MTKCEFVNQEGKKELELSIVMPCLNEAETLSTCIDKAQKFLSEYNINGEVVIGDNGSTDGSQQIAMNHGARVVNIESKGYGNALMGAIESSIGEFIIMGDSDDSYDFSELMPFVLKLRDGYDLVMGNRFKGGIKKGAMPFLHYYVGNPVLSFVGRLFFSNKIGDFHCGLRGLKKEAYYKMNLHTTGMEFATEMVVKSTFTGLKITEVPTILYPDGRTRPPHLRTWRDGWRHLRFMLIYSPRWLFLFPGIFMMTIGAIGGGILFNGPITLSDITFDIDTLAYMSILFLIGFQCTLFYFLAKAFAINSELLPFDASKNESFKYINLESGLFAACLFILMGLIGTYIGIHHWDNNGFGTMDPGKLMRIIIPSITSLLLGVQLFFGSFLFSMLGLKKN